MEGGAHEFFMKPPVISHCRLLKIIGYLRDKARQKLEQMQKSDEILRSSHMGAMKTAKQERKWYWQAAIGVLIGWLLGQSVIKMENSCKRGKGYSVDYTSEDSIPDGELDGKHSRNINFSFCFNT